MPPTSPATHRQSAIRRHLAQATLVAALAWSCNDHGSRQRHLILALRLGGGPAGRRHPG